MYHENVTQAKSAESSVCANITTWFSIQHVNERDLGYTGEWSHIQVNETTKRYNVNRNPFDNFINDKIFHITF